MSALIIYDKRTLFDIGHRYINLLQDTLSTNPTWPLEILRNTEENNGHLNNPRRRKKHHGKRAGIRNRLRERAHSSPLHSILHVNVQSLENKMDDLRARISFQRDIRDCNILCLPETRLTPSVNKKWCDPRSISILSRSCLAHLEHLSIICRPFYLPRKFSSIIATAVYIPPQADHRQTPAWLCPNSTMCSGDTSTNTLTLPLSSQGTLTKSNSGRSSRTFISIYPVQLEDRIHWIIATLRLKRPTMPTHYWLLANRIMPPFSSHRNINKGSFRNPRWREKWRAGPPTLKLCYRRLLMMSTGTCSG